jgi:hypothetical protein
MNQQIFFKLALNRRGPSKGISVLGTTLRDGLWAFAVEERRGLNLPEYFEGAERIDTARAIVLCLKVQVCRFKLLPLQFVNDSGLNALSSIFYGSDEQKYE